MTSAEPGRRAPYSADLRWRIVWQRIGMERSFRMIAQSLNISVGTAFNVFRIFEVTGEIEPKHRKYSGNIVDNSTNLTILAIVLEKPSLYLSEIIQQIYDCTGKKICPSTLCGIMHKHGITRKKIQQVAIQRSDQYRGVYMAEVSMYKTNMLVFVDETGKDARDSARRFGYALRGQTPQFHRSLNRGVRTSVIAAISSSGLIGYELHTGGVSGEEFYDFVRGTLIPNMNPFDGESDNSILILDNCSIHHVENVVTLLQQSGILVLFLPPYSPDFNPIELTFSYLKKYLQEHDEMIQATNNLTDVLKSAMDNINKEYCSKWISNCGY